MGKQSFQPMSDPVMTSTAHCATDTQTSLPQANKRRERQRRVWQLIEHSMEREVSEPCVSPMLWSESFGLRLDG